MNVERLNPKAVIVAADVDTQGNITAAKYVGPKSVRILLTSEEVSILIQELLPLIEETSTADMLLGKLLDKLIAFDTERVS